MASTHFRNKARRLLRHRHLDPVAIVRQRPRGDIESRAQPAPGFRLAPTISKGSLTPAARQGPPRSTARGARQERVEVVARHRPQDLGQRHRRAAPRSGWHCPDLAASVPPIAAGRIGSPAFFTVSTLGDRKFDVEMKRPMAPPIRSLLCGTDRRMRNRNTEEGGETMPRPRTSRRRHRSFRPPREARR